LNLFLSGLSLAYPNLLGKKDYVVVVVVERKGRCVHQKQTYNRAKNYNAMNMHLDLRTASAEWINLPQCGISAFKLPACTFVA